MKKQSAINTFFNVVKALFLREIQTRFGSRKMGYFWALAEPAAFIIVFVLVKVLLFNRIKPGVDFTVFISVGIITFFLFRNILISSMNAFESNRALFNYHQVKPIYTILSRLLVESLVSSVLFIIFIFIGWFFYYEIDCADILFSLISIIWLVLFSFSLGLLLGVLGGFFETLKRIIKILMTPLIFLSGIFYTISDLPMNLREYITYNPLIHFMELLHGSYFKSLDTSYVDFMYIIYWTLIPLTLGLFLYIRTERKIISS